MYIIVGIMEVLMLWCWVDSMLVFYDEFFFVFFVFKQKTAYEMRISDWSSDVCSSDLRQAHPGDAQLIHLAAEPRPQQCRARCGSQCTSDFAGGLTVDEQCRLSAVANKRDMRPGAGSQRRTGAAIAGGVYEEPAAFRNQRHAARQREKRTVRTGLHPEADRKRTCCKSAGRQRHGRSAFELEAMPDQIGRAHV